MAIVHFYRLLIPGPLSTSPDCFPQSLCLTNAVPLPDTVPALIRPECSVCSNTQQPEVAAAAALALRRTREAAATVGKGSPEGAGIAGVSASNSSQGGGDKGGDSASSGAEPRSGGGGAHPASSGGGSGSGSGGGDARLASSRGGNTALTLSPLRNSGASIAPASAVRFKLGPSPIASPPPAHSASLPPLHEGSDAQRVSHELACPHNGFNAVRWDSACACQVESHVYEGWRCTAWGFEPVPV